MGAAIVIPVGVIISFRYVDLLTQRFALRTPEQLASGESRPRVRMPALAPVAKVALASVGGARRRRGDPAERSGIGGRRGRDPRVVGLDVDTTVDALSVVGWVVSDAHRLADDGPANSYVLDVRTAGERAAAPIGTAIELEPTADTGDLVDGAIAAIDGTYGEAARNKPIVVLSSADPASTTVVVRSLREHGVNAFALDGGNDAWRAVVFDDAAPWPAAVVDRRR
ncbi:MAG: rhodanese-like domain-containing protein [Ilumatobacteraceae bacterium]